MFVLLWHSNHNFLPHNIEDYERDQKFKSHSFDLNLSVDCFPFLNSRDCKNRYEAVQCVFLKVQEAQSQTTVVGDNKEKSTQASLFGLCLKIINQFSDKCPASFSPLQYLDMCVGWIQILLPGLDKLSPLSDVKNEIRTSPSSFWNVMLQYCNT